MSTTRPTEKQIQFLTARGIICPPTRKSCSGLINFIKKGNMTVGSNESERVGILKASQARWLGKRVRYEPDGDGTVLYLRAKHPDKVKQQRLGVPGEPAHKVGPFEAAVQFDSGRRVGHTLSYLMLL